MLSIFPPFLIFPFQHDFISRSHHPLSFVSDSSVPFNRKQTLRYRISLHSILFKTSFFLFHLLAFPSLPPSLPPPSPSLFPLFVLALRSTIYDLRSRIFCVHALPLFPFLSHPFSPSLKNSLSLTFDRLSPACLSYVFSHFVFFFFFF